MRQPTSTLGKLCCLIVRSVTPSLQPGHFFQCIARISSHAFCFMIPWREMPGWSFVAASQEKWCRWWMPLWTTLFCTYLSTVICSNRMVPYFEGSFRDHVQNNKMDATVEYLTWLFACILLKASLLTEPSSHKVLSQKLVDCFAWSPCWPGSPAHYEQGQPAAQVILQGCFPLRS